MSDPVEIVRTALVDEPGVAAAYLFGSAAEDRTTRWSDVDIALLWSTDVAPSEQFRRELQLGIRLEEAFKRRVDLVNLNRAPPFVAFQVLKTGILVLDKDPESRSLFVMRALNTYYDMQRYFDYQNACALERFEQRGLRGGSESHRGAAATIADLR